MSKPKRNRPSISITFDPEVLKLLDKGNYNASKLIDTLLTEYFKNNK